MDEDVAIRLLMLDQKVSFMFQILSLTQTTPDGPQTTIFSPFWTSRLMSRKA